MSHLTHKNEPLDQCTGSLTCSILLDAIANAGRFLARWGRVLVPTKGEEDATGENTEVHGNGGADVGAGRRGGPCTGTTGEDTMYGTQESDEMHALEGDDTVYGYGGQDDLEADNIFNPSEGGDDKLYGGDDVDILRTYSGRDLLAGGGATDLIEATSEWWELTNPSREPSAPAVVDTFKGGGGADTIRATDGFKDVINCGKGKDTVEYDVGLDKIRYCEIKNP
jgi:Ca2+-binding RTX toxin-like protein